MTFQPVQMQMMAYQPVVQQQVVQQMVQPMVQQVVQRPIQQVAVQQVARPQQVAVVPASTNTCDICEHLEDLKKRVAELSDKIDGKTGGTGATNDLERRIAQNEEAVEKLTEASNLQTEILERLEAKLNP